MKLNEAIEDDSLGERQVTKGVKPRVYKNTANRVCSP